MGIFDKIKSLLFKSTDKEEPLFEQDSSQGDTKSVDWLSTDMNSDSKKEDTTSLEEKGNKLVDKAQDLAEEVGSDIIDETSKLYKKGKEGIKDISETAKEKYRQLEEQALEDKAIEDSKPEYDNISHAEKLRQTDLLENTDDFFSKAAKFADGDHKAAREGAIEIQDSAEEVVEHKNAKTKGFEDLDGDGDDIVDDAIIEKE